MAYSDQPFSMDGTAPRVEQIEAGSSQPSAEQRASITRPIRTAAAIWAGYILVLAGVDHVFVLASAIKSPLPAPYYISQLLLALSVLVFAHYSRASVRPKRAFLPAVIVIMAALPLIATVLTVPSSFPGPLSGATGLVGLRLLPMLTVAVALTAWQYRKRHVFLFVLGTTVLFVVLHLRPPFSPLNVVAIAVVQGMGLLILGLFVSALMDKLRVQRASLEQANAQLRHYTSTLEQFAISRERNRVARELHDTLAHTLSGLIVQLETTKACWEAGHSASEGMLQAALDTARSGLHETRCALRSLRASPLDDLGLSLALRSLAEQASAWASLRLDCDLTDDLPVLAPDVEQCIYRVAQEALANVAQHAEATALQVGLSYTEGSLRLVVHDDGRGFHQELAVDDGHFGLAGMYERAVLAGGRLVITSTPGAGTTVSLQF